MNYATLAYLPPARLGREPFLRNISAYQTEYPLILFSDNGTDEDVDVIIPDPTSIKLSKNRVAIHNRIFLHAVEIAQQKNINRFIYLEGDCRVGHDLWDSRVFEEASQYKDMFVAGTPAMYNESAMTKAQKAAYDECAKKYREASGFAIPSFSAKRPRPIGAWFIMGGGAVYNTSVMADIFMGFERDAHQKAAQSPAFDLFVGMRCVQLFKEKSVRKLPFLTSIFSTYGNRINEEKDRIAMVKSGKYAVVHQIKTDTDCL